MVSPLPPEAVHELRKMKFILVIVLLICAVLGVFVAYTVWEGRDGVKHKTENTVPTRSTTSSLEEKNHDADATKTANNERDLDANVLPSVTVNIKNVTWEYGFKKLSEKETLALMQRRVPMQASTQIVINDADHQVIEGPYFREPALCGEGDKDLRCHLVVYRAGVIQSEDTRWNNTVLYRFFFPSVDGGGGAGGYGVVDSSESFFGLYDQSGYIHLFKTDQYSQPENSFSPFVGAYYGVTWGDAEQFMDTPPSTLSSVRKDGVLEFKDAATIFGGLQGFTLIDHSVYTAKNKVGTFPQGTLYAMDGGVYHLVYPHGEVLRYDLRPYFLTQHTPSEAEKNMYVSGFDAQIVWNDGRTRVNDTYIIGGRVGKWFCSPLILPCTNVVTTTDWFRADNITVVGKTTRGENVYELKNAKDNILYQEFFDLGFSSRARVLHPEQDFPYQWSDEQKANYFDEYLADHPIFFWKDEKGEWRFYQKTGYQSLAECGKPVIYLYPEKTSTVRVQVEPTGGFTKVEPAYPEGGWVVNATPESILTNSADGKVYPYLFWEGIAYNYTKPTEGFVLSKENVHRDMVTLLARMGMNKKESTDFLEFWEEKLKVKPYVFVTFVPQSEFDKMAPLTVEPKPDTVIRVFMDYTPLDAPINVKPQQINTPERKGFTVVEWGGALHR